MVACPKLPKLKNEKHRRFIASLQCCVSGIQGRTQCAHIRSGNAGMGMKSPDFYCVPLSVEMHQLQGEIGEQKFWEPYGGIERAKELAAVLWVVSGNTDMALDHLAGFMR